MLRTRELRFWESGLIYQGVRERTCRPSGPARGFVTIPEVLFRTWDREVPSMPELESRMESTGWSRFDIPPRPQTACGLRIRQCASATPRPHGHTGTWGRGGDDRKLAFGLHFIQVQPPRERGLFIEKQDAVAARPSLRRLRPTICFRAEEQASKSCAKYLARTYAVQVLSPACSGSVGSLTNFDSLAAAFLDQLAA